MEGVNVLVAHALPRLYVHDICAGSRERERVVELLAFHSVLTGITFSTNIAVLHVIVISSRGASCAVGVLVLRVQCTRSGSHILIFR